ncbi:hypothetical protein LTR64_008133 [Lithohypha guttulata]|uniref:uncharacterized protein n=1 Tax=Lithohypha guttulata TaxID=1690604 RepID=UPI002DDF18A7|nr:hypothetical protein LTR51_008285 [Lithohypha guttulata]
MEQQSRDSLDEDVDYRSAWSLASTHADLVYEYGRRFPNYRYGSQPFARGDELASRNERVLHLLMLHLYDNKLYTAPIEDLRNVLDVRCGMHGLWARNMADLFPEAQVTGFDQFIPDTEGRENLSFILQSYNDSWILDEITEVHGKLDFVYARGLMAGSQNYPEFYKQCFEHLKPGGYLEETEVVPYCSCDDGIYREDSAVRAVCNLRPALERAMGRDYNLATNMKRLIEEAGFVEVQERIDKVPWSPWPNPATDLKGHESGRIFQRYYESGIQGWILQPCIRHMNMTADQVNDMCEKAINELAQLDEHWYSPCITITARKPFSNTNQT